MDGRVDPEATQSVYVDGAMEVRCCLPVNFGIYADVLDPKTSVYGTRQLALMNAFLVGGLCWFLEKRMLVPDFYGFGCHQFWF